MALRGYTECLEKIGFPSSGKQSALQRHKRAQARQSGILMFPWAANRILE